MKKELEHKLCSKFPELCRDYEIDPKDSCMAWGFDCGDGWYDLIESTLANIDRLSKSISLDVKLAQVKSKFGRLTIYIDIESGPAGAQIQQVISQIYNEIEEAGIKSLSISEISGKPAKQFVVNSYVYTITNEEAEELEILNCLNQNATH